MKEKLANVKKSTEKIKKMVETFIDENSFTIWYHIMANKNEAKGLYPNMMSLLELRINIPSSTVEVERGCSVMKLFCTCLRASVLPSARLSYR